MNNKNIVYLVSSATAKGVLESQVYAFAKYISQNFEKEGFCPFDPRVCLFRMPQIPCIKEAINGKIVYEGFWERRSILFCALDKCIEMVGIRMISSP